MQQLSVLIPTYNDASLLPETLAPLLRDPATGEVLVVVDGSCDGSYKLLTDIARRDDRVRPFWIENRGHVGARQYGFEHARHDVLLMLDADVVASDGLVSGHAAWHERGADRLVIGYMPPVIPPRRPGSFVIERYAHQYELACQGYESDPRERFARLWMGNVSVGRRALLAEHRFERSVSGFLKTSHTFGQDLVRLERAHPGQGRFPGWRDSAFGSALVGFLARPRGYALARGISLDLLGLAGRARLWTLEGKLGALLDRIEVNRGILAESRRHA